MSLATILPHTSKVLTDNKPLPLITWYDLTPEEQEEYDWVATNDIDHRESCLFYREERSDGTIYTGYVLDNLERITPEKWNVKYKKAWQFAEATGFFSATLFLFVTDDDGDTKLVLGTYIC
jgi:hypothetical protein